MANYTVIKSKKGRSAKKYILMLIIIFLIIFLISFGSGKKPYRFLNTDSLESIELSDTFSNKNAIIKNKSEMKILIDAIRPTKVYNNLLLRNLSKRQCTISLIYEDGHKKIISIAISDENEKITSNSNVSAIATGMRWYRIDPSMAQNIYDAYSKVR